MEFTTGPRTAAGHGAPRPRVIGAGDLAHFEFAGVAARYHVTAMTTMAVTSASKRIRDLHRICAESVTAGVAAVKVGAPAAAAEIASLRPLEREGIDGFAIARFGYGIGVAYPPIWLETLQISRTSAHVLQAGMVFVLHTTLTLPDENLGFMQGGTYLLTETGVQMLVGDGDSPLVTV
jgi:Xaa-Pro aminopeptidase